MKVDDDAYPNVRAIQTRLNCVDSSMHWYLGQRMSYTTSRRSLCHGAIYMLSKKTVSTMGKFIIPYKEAHPSWNFGAEDSRLGLFLETKLGLTCTDLAGSELMIAVDTNRTNEVEANLPLRRFPCIYFHHQVKDMSLYSFIHAQMEKSFRNESLCIRNDGGTATVDKMLSHLYETCTIMERPLWESRNARWGEALYSSIEGRGFGRLRPNPSS